MDVKGEVAKLIKKYKTTDPFRIAKAKHIMVFREILGNIWGYHNYDSRFHFIHINNLLSEQEELITCAHELGHVVLHPKTSTSFLKRSTFFSVDKIERQANRFAAELLLPDSLLQQYPDSSIYQLANMVGVPQALVKLKTIGCIKK